MKTLIISKTLIGILLFHGYCYVNAQQSESLTKYVDPFIGVDNEEMVLPDPY
jgi:hypothetical protein